MEINKSNALKRNNTATMGTRMFRFCHLYDLELDTARKKLKVIVPLSTDNIEISTEVSSSCCEMK
jgi:hypothetical protein